MRTVFDAIVADLGNAGKEEDPSEYGCSVVWMSMSSIPLRGGGDPVHDRVVLQIGEHQHFLGVSL